MGTWGTVTNTALGQSTGVELWHRGLGFLPDGCNVHTGQHNKVGEGRVCHHVVHQDLGGLLPVHPQLRPRQDLWESTGVGTWGPEAQALPSPEGAGAVGYSQRGRVWCTSEISCTSAPEELLVAWQCISTKPEELQNC